MSPEIIGILVYPAVLLVLGFVLILILRAPLIGLVKRIEHLKLGAAEANISRQIEQQQLAVSTDHGKRPEGLAVQERIAAPGANVAMAAGEATGNAEAIGVAAITEGPDGAAAVGSAAMSITGHEPAAVIAMTPERAAAIRDFGVSPLITSSEAAIHRDLQILPEADRVNILVRHLAVAQLQAGAEKIYRVIYGSQIAVLQHLNHFGPTPITKLEEDFYKPAVSRFPEVYARHSTSAQSYFGYLEQVNLLERVGTDKDHYAITAVGRGFLQWLVAEGIAPNKAL